MKIELDIPDEFNEILLEYSNCIEALNSLDKKLNSFSHQNENLSDFIFSDVWDRSRSCTEKLQCSREEFIRAVSEWKLSQIFYHGVKG